MTAAPANDLDIDIARLEHQLELAQLRHQEALDAGRDTRTTGRRIHRLEQQLAPMRRALAARQPLSEIEQASVELVRQGLDALAGPDGYAYTDLGNAKRLVAHHGEHLRFIASWGRWMVFDGSRWQLDHADTLVRRMAAETGPELLRHIAEVRQDDRKLKQLIAHAKYSESRTGIGACAAVASTQQAVAMGHELLDKDPWLLNVRNGTLDLTTGTFHRPRPGDHLTMVAAVDYDPTGTAPEWTAMLERIQPDPEVRALLQRLAGLALAGQQVEHVLPILIGGGANGKSTVTRIIASVLGEYSTVANRDLLLAAKHDTHPTAKAELFRKRFAHLGELPAGAHLDEAQVKELTGGDRVTARRMREDFWSFDPSHLLWVHANHRPRIQGTDDAIWRRVLLIPFDVQIPEADRDPHLADRVIANESAGVLSWMLAGLADYRAKGLRPPERVRAATRAYRGESDTVAGFIAEAELVVAETLEITSNDLMQLHGEWFTAAGIGGPEKAHYQRVAAALTDAGAVKRKSRSRGGWYWHGVGQKVTADEHDDEARQRPPTLPVDRAIPPAYRDEPERLAPVGAADVEDLFR